MMIIHQVLIRLFTLASFILASCSGGVPQEEDNTPQQPTASVPSFNQDSAYAYVEKQVSFGPRVPNTEAHLQTALWLEQTMKRFADTVIVQEAKVRAYDGTILDIRNIIGSFRPENVNRILLCAHWDSRPYADHDPNPQNHYTPIDGANDGGSGVGVLLEVARLLDEQQPQVGIDIIFFDAEDYGQHEQDPGHETDSWALGSQYWARNPHNPAYNPSYGILLDMVGASGATFKYEGYSRMYAPDILDKVWSAAHRAGYGDYFIKENSSHITDDHYYINKIRNIPTIDIIHQDENTPHGFFPQWHTVDDTMEYIDKATLKAVGQTVLTVIYLNP